MDYLHYLLVVVVIFIHSSFCSSSDWCYKDPCGPSNWTALGNSICGQTSQSPVNIVEDSATYDTTLVPFTLAGFGASSSAHTIVNDGHTAKVTFNGDLSVSGSTLPETYKAAQFHFHWGPDNTAGSEHTTDGMAYPMEMHIVNYGQQYGNLGAAVDQPNGLAVLGFYIKQSPSNTDNTNYATLISALSNIQYADQEGSVSGLNIRSMMPSNIDNYFRYAGSLTTPPCYQSVIWTVFKDVVELSSSQINAFRNLKKTNQTVTASLSISMNYRPIQNLNGRQVSRSFTLSSAPSIVSNLYQIVFFLSIGLFYYY